MKIGNYTVSLLNYSFFGLDGGAMFGIIPKPLWNKSYPCDEANRIKLSARLLLLESDSKTILIDTGMGGGWDEKFNRIYDCERQTGGIDQLLKQHSLSPNDITDVILTHLHFDHTGGSTQFRDGKWEPAFPNAKYHIQREHFEWSQKASERDKGSFIQNRIQPLAEEGVLNFINGSKEFDENIKLITTNGHTFAQQIVKISGGDKTLLYCADLIPTSAHIPIPYVMGYDLQPLLTVKEKKEILNKAADENWALVFEHDAYTPAVTIERTEKGFGIKEKYSF